MKQKRQWILCAAALLGLLGLVLRWYVLQNCMDQAHMLLPGSGALTALLIYILTAVGIMAALIWGTNKVPGGEACFSRAPGWLFAGLAGAVAVCLGSLAQLLSRPDLDAFGRYVALGGILSGVLMALSALLRGKPSKILFWTSVVPGVWALAKLIWNFKDWSFDPMVVDFCLRLSALICATIALYLHSGFPLGWGEKRFTIFWGLCAGIFTLAALPDYFMRWGFTAPELLILFGMAAYGVTGALQLLRDAPQSATPPGPDTDTDTEPTSTPPTP